MYIQITTKCNMNCSHCCNYEENGEHMTFDMFKEVLNKWGETLKKNNRCIVLGGGEPTIHPNFWEIIDYSKKYGLPWLATNGKRTDDLIKLTHMAKEGEIYVVLSLDRWHEKINIEAENMFRDGLIQKNKNYWYPEKGKGNKDKREIRTCLNPAYSGRWKIKKRTSCHCKEVRVKPNGNIYCCGCESSDIEHCPIIGTVYNGIEEKYKYVDIVNVGKCYKDYIEKDGYYIKK